MRWLILIAALMTSGCGVGYASPHGLTRMEFRSAADMDAADQAIRGKLLAMGFHLHTAQGDAPNAGLDFGRDDEPGGEQSLTVRLNACISDACVKWSDALTSGIERHYPLIELYIDQWRPGGFSPDGLRAYDELQAFLGAKGYQPITITAPPVNEAEHDRIFAMNLAAGMIWWTITWMIGGGLALFAADWALTAMRLALVYRRIALALVGVVVATPMPAFWTLGSMLVPNILVLGSGLPYYAMVSTQFGLFVPVSFGASLILSMGAAMLLTRKPRITAIVGGAPP